MTQATVRRWRKEAGEPFGKGDVLLEVETDEGLVEVEAAVAGRLDKILVQAGRSVAVGTSLAEMADGEPSASSIGQAMDRGEGMYEDVRNQQKQEAKVSSSNPTAPAGPVIPVLMPQAGQSMEEGTLVKWHVKPGERIRRARSSSKSRPTRPPWRSKPVDDGRLSRNRIEEGGVKEVKSPSRILRKTTRTLTRSSRANQQRSNLQHRPPRRGASEAKRAPPRIPLALPHQ